MKILNLMPNAAVHSVKRIARHVLGRYIKAHQQFRAGVEGKFGLEIGGPSSVFRNDGVLPLYRDVAGLDNCVYAIETVWEGKRPEGLTFSYQQGKPNGFNYTRETTNLGGIADANYDFVLSSHSLEHTSNPIKAIREWIRVVRPYGALIVFLPDYHHTFDHRRAPTPIEHMVQDYELGKDEKDLTHLEEILELHDLSRDPLAGSKEQFQQRSLHNFENRCLHHHVFDHHNSRQLLETAGLTVELVELVKPFHIAILARCPSVIA